MESHDVERLNKSDVELAKEYREYIEKVCQAAADEEHKPNELLWQTCEINRTVLIALKSKYQKVKSRVINRLIHNFERLFKKPLCVLPINTADSRMLLPLDMPYNLFPLSACFHPFYSLVEWKVFGHKYTIRATAGHTSLCPNIEGNEVLSNKTIVNDLIEAYGRDDFLQIPWSEYISFCEEHYGWQKPDLILEQKNYE